MNVQNNPIAGLASSLLVGQKQQLKNMIVFPLFTHLEDKCDYLSLSEAIEQKSIEITEVSQGGSVPNLKVINKGPNKVLLVDSEELKGAKQNRIMNTSILLKKESETIIPVSCTEHGRWSYDSKDFKTSGYVADPDLRRKKAKSVSDNLMFSASFVSNQQEVWNEISEKRVFSKASSLTGAMADNYHVMESKLKEYQDIYRTMPKQCGILVLINGKVAGLDYISSIRVFKQIYQKLMRSYAMQAEFSLVRWHGQKELSSDPGDFIEKVMFAKTKQYKSPGHGWDIRLVSKETAGNALIYKNEVIQMSAFENNK